MYPQYTKQYKQLLKMIAFAVQFSWHHAQLGDLCTLNTQNQINNYWTIIVFTMQFSWHHSHLGDLCTLNTQKIKQLLKFIAFAK